MRSLLLTVLLLGATPVSAQETTIYTYDALGRIKTSSVSGGSASGTATSVQYDPAGNRVNYRVAGSPNGSTPPSAMTVIVVPLNGFTVIPIGN